MGYDAGQRPRFSATEADLFKDPVEETRSRFWANRSDLFPAPRGDEVAKKTAGDFPGTASRIKMDSRPRFSATEADLFKKPDEPDRPRFSATEADFFRDPAAVDTATDLPDTAPVPEPRKTELADLPAETETPPQEPGTPIDPPDQPDPFSTDPRPPGLYPAPRRRVSEYARELFANKAKDRAAAANKYAAQRLSEEEDIPIEEAYRSLGVSPPKEYDVWAGAKELGKLAWDFKVNVLGAAASAFEDDNPEAEYDWKDIARRAQADRHRLRAAQLERSGQGEKYVLPFLQVKDILETSQSTGFSAVGMAAGAPGMLLTRGGPAGMVVGIPLALFGSGLAAYRQDKTMFSQQLIDAYRQAVREDEQREVTPEEVDALMENTRSLRREHALWEAIPEAVGNVAQMAGIGKLFTGALGEGLGARVLKVLAGMYGAEMTTETITQTGQYNVEVKAGLSNAPRRSWFVPADIAESAKEVGPSVFLLTTLMAGGGLGARAGSKAGGRIKDRYLPSSEVVLDSLLVDPRQFNRADKHQIRSLLSGALDKTNDLSPEYEQVRALLQPDKDGAKGVFAGGVGLNRAARESMAGVVNQVELRSAEENQQQMAELMEAADREALSGEGAVEMAAIVSQRRRSDRQAQAEAYKRLLDEDNKPSGSNEPAGGVEALSDQDLEAALLGVSNWTQDPTQNGFMLRNAGRLLERLVGAAQKRGLLPTSKDVPLTPSHKENILRKRRFQALSNMGPVTVGENRYSLLPGDESGKTAVVVATNPAGESSVETAPLEIDQARGEIMALAEKHRADRAKIPSFEDVGGVDASAGSPRLKVPSPIPAGRLWATTPADLSGWWSLVMDRVAGVEMGNADLINSLSAQLSNMRPVRPVGRPETVKGKGTKRQRRQILESMQALLREPAQMRDRAAAVLYNAVLPEVRNRAVADGVPGAQTELIVGDISTAIATGKQTSETMEGLYQAALKKHQPGASPKPQPGASPKPQPVVPSRSSVPAVPAQVVSDPFDTTGTRMIDLTTPEGRQKHTSALIGLDEKRGNERDVTDHWSGPVRDIHRKAIGQDLESFAREFESQDYDTQIELAYRYGISQDVVDDAMSGHSSDGKTARDVAGMIRARIKEGRLPRKRPAEMSQEELYVAATTSYLTGLKNRAGWDADTQPRRAAKAMIDADSLKYYNDNWGHGVGDQLLRRVADGFRAAGLEERAAHLSGDEFAAYGDDTKSLDNQLQAVQQWLYDNPLKIENADGSGNAIWVVPEVTHATSESSLIEADGLLPGAKQRREAQGLRAGRGQRPGLVFGQPPSRRDIGDRQQALQHERGLDKQITPEALRSLPATRLIERAHQVGVAESVINSFDKKAVISAILEKLPEYLQSLGLSSQTPPAQPSKPPAIKGSQPDPTSAPVSDDLDPGDTQVSPEQPSPLSEVSVLGKEGTAYLADLTPVRFRYALAPADNLIISHNRDFTPNENLPDGLQPRGRSRFSMKHQAMMMSQGLIPGKLGHSPDASTGAPFVFRDRAVEGGHGRSWALREAHITGRAEEYVAWLVENASDFGFTPEQVRQTPNVILVRERLTDFEDRAEFAEKTNDPEVAAMSPLEMAELDARRLTDKDMALFRPSENGDIGSSSNHRFIVHFLDKLSTARSGYTTSRGDYTRGLLDRIASAVFHKAYNNSDLTELVSEARDQEVRNIIKGLLVVSPEFMKLRESGQPIVDNSIRAITDAVEYLRLAKQADPKIALAKAVNNYRQQYELDGYQASLSPGSDLAVDFFVANTASGKKIADFLRSIAAKLRKHLDEAPYRDNIIGGEALEFNFLEEIQNAIARSARPGDTAGPAAAQMGFKAGDDTGRPGGQPGTSERSANYYSTERPGLREVSEGEGGINEGLLFQRTRPARTPRQLEFDFELAPQALTPESDPFPGALSAAYQSVRMATTGHIGAASVVVRGDGDAAAVLSHLRNRPQENAYFITTDADGTILEIFRYAQGTKDRAVIDPAEVAGHVFGIEGARKVWFAHNHPSGKPTPSPEDYNISEKISALLQAGGVASRSIIIGENQYWSMAEDGPAELPSPSQAIQIPEVEAREVVFHGGPAAEIEVGNARQAQEAIEKYFGSRDGLLLLNIKNRVVGFFDLPRHIPMSRAVAEVLKAAYATQARAMILNSTKPLTYGGRQAFVDGLALGAHGGGLPGLDLYDVIENGKSLADQGMLPKRSKEPTTGPLKDERGGEMVFRRAGETTLPSEATATTNQALAAELSEKFPGAPRQRFARTEADLPGPILDEIKRKNAQGMIPAIYWKRANEIWYVESMLHDRAMFERAWLHESIGHAGVEAVLGDQQTLEFFAGVVDTRESDPGLKEIAARYGLNLKEPTDRITAGREYVAHLAELGVEDSILNQLISLIRSALRQAGFHLEVSDTEIKAVIARGARHVANRRGGVPGQIKSTFGQERKEGRKGDLPSGVDVWKENGKWYVGNEKTGVADRSSIGKTKQEAIGKYLETHAGSMVLDTSLEPLFQTVHHGGPHTWQPEPGFPHGRARLDKIGTGEGAQAYGWGIYLAEAEAVALGYQSRLGDGVYFDKNGRRVLWSDPYEEIISAARKDGHGISSATKFAEGWSEYIDNPDGANQYVRDYLKKHGITEKRSGAIYTLDLPDSALPQLLDWDAPLSEQGEYVKRAVGKASVNINEFADLQKAAISQGMAPDEIRMFSDHQKQELLREYRETADADFQAIDYTDMTGERFYHSLSANLGSDKAASEHLASIGIPGLKYFDGVSRDKGDGSRNHVIWDQPTLDQAALLERNGEKLDAIRDAQEDQQAPGPLSRVMDAPVFQRAGENPLGDRTAEALGDKRLKTPGVRSELADQTWFEKIVGLKDPRKAYQEMIGDPLFHYWQAIPEAVGRRIGPVDWLGRQFIQDYGLTEEYADLRDETRRRIILGRKKAEELSRAIAAFPKAERRRIGQVLEGSITTDRTRVRYSQALRVAEEFKALQEELKELGLLGPDNRFTQLTRKQIKAAFDQMADISRQIVGLENKLSPRGKVERRQIGRATETITEIVEREVVEDAGAVGTRLSRAVEHNEARVREALINRGFAEGEADTMVRRVKESALPAETKAGASATVIKKTISRTIERSVAEVITKTKTYDRSFMARARGSIVKDINKLKKDRDDILGRIQTHYKMSGKQYLRLMYDQVESEKKLLSGLRAYFTNRLQRGYEKQRQDLDPKWRWDHRLDTTELVMRGLSTERHDAEMLRMFTRISENPDWAVPANQWSELTEADPKKYAGWKGIPDTAAYRMGPLAGMMIDPYVYTALNQSIKEQSELMRAYDKALQLWKTGKIVYNPATQSRNVMSGFILNDMGDLPFWRVDIYAAAARSIKNKDALYDEAVKNYAVGTEWAGHEITKFLSEAERLNPDDGSMLTQGVRLAKYLADLPGKSYQGIEQFFKMALYLDQKQKGRTPRQAAKHAQKWGFDYTAVPPGIQWAKRWFSPFITFSYKALPRMAEVSIRKPWKMAKYAGLFYVVETATRLFHGESDDEAERERRVLPGWMRRHALPGMPSHLRVPVTDEWGRSKYMDLSYILPWGDLGDQWGQSRLQMVPQAFLPSHPLWISVAQVAFNEVMFTGQELTKDWMTAGEYSFVLGRELWRQAMPSLAGSYSFNKLMSAINGERDWAGRDRSLPEAVFDVFLGIKLRSIDYTEELGYRLRENREDIREIEWDFARDYRDLYVKKPNLSDEKRKEKEEEIYTKYNRRIDRVLKRVDALVE